MTEQTQPPSLYRSDDHPGPGVDRSSRGLRADDRAVSEVLGSILLFGLLMALLVLIQTNAVPAQNQQVEFEHNQRVQADMLELDRAILQAATVDVPTTADIELSARYPSRFFLVNPPTGAGSIATVASGSVTVSNARAPGAPAYWDGSVRSFDTTVLRYRPDYNQYRNAPETAYEHNTLVNTFPSGVGIPLDSGSFIEGDQILLLLVDGELATAGDSTETVAVTPVSAPAGPMALKNDTAGNITLSLPTTLTASQWETILGDETVANGGHITGIEVTTGDPLNTLNVSLEPGSYELRMALVSVGRGGPTGPVTPHYLTAETGQTESIRADESRALRVRLYDRFNNPAPGDVTFSSPDGEFERPDGTRVDELVTASGENGAADAVFVPDSAFRGIATVTVSGDLDGDGTVQPRERTEFTVRVTQPGDELSPDDPNGVAGVNPGTPGSVRLEGVSLTGNTVTLNLTNTGSTAQQVERARLAFYLSNSAITAITGQLNGDAGDEIVLYGDWDDVDQTIIVPAGSSQELDITFSPQANQGDFFGIAIEYDGSFANYYVQVPPN